MNLRDGAWFGIVAMTDAVEDEEHTVTGVAAQEREMAAVRSDADPATAVDVPQSHEPDV